MSRVIKSGNSLAVTIPNKFAHMVGVKKGDEVKIEKRTEKSLLIIHFSGAQQLTLSSRIRHGESSQIKEKKAKKT